MSKLRVLVAVLLLVVGLGACSSKSKSSSAKPSVDTFDFRFSPTSFSVKAGSKVTVSLKNQGTVEHNFSIASAGVNKDLAKGASATVTFTAPSTAGDVQYFCEYHKDSKGMVGTLHVT